MKKLFASAKQRGNLHKKQKTFNLILVLIPSFICRGEQTGESHLHRGMHCHQEQIGGYGS